MSITSALARLDRATLQTIQEALRALELDGWLLYDFHGLNPIAGGVLGLPAMTRRYFVYLPARGEPVALTHRIEQQPWSEWIGENRPYLSWRELEEGIGRLVAGGKRVAMEYAAGDAVPYVDRVPAGVVELVRAAGAEVVESGDLVSAFHARWTPEGEASHRRAADVVRDVAHEAFASVGQQLRAGGRPTEWSVREWVCAELRVRGLTVGADSIVAVNANAANPHYAPSEERHASIAAGDLLLIDLWGKESEQAVYADQTWMAFLGEEVPAHVEAVWGAVRDARDAAVELVRARWATGAAVAGYEVDDAARAVIRERGHADHFIHRTGHSIDRELHGSGPNIDNLETRDTRRLITGVGFSIEPGIYLPGELGFRSEVNVFIGPDGPEVTTPEPQHDLVRITVGRGGAETA